MTFFKEKNIFVEISNVSLGMMMEYFVRKFTKISIHSILVIVHNFVSCVHVTVVKHSKNPFPWSVDSFCQQEISKTEHVLFTIQCVSSILKLKNQTIIPVSFSLETIDLQQSWHGKLQ